MLLRAHWVGSWCPISIALSLTLANAASSPAWGIVNRGNVSVVSAAQSCSSFSPTRGGMARLSRPRATVCRFPAHRNYAVTRVSAAEFEPGTVRLRIQRATTEPPRHTYKGWSENIDWNDFEMFIIQKLPIVSSCSWSVSRATRTSGRYSGQNPDLATFQSSMESAICRSAGHYTATPTSWVQSITKLQ